MLTVAYLANQFPSPLEPYVFEEIAELRRRGLAVIPCSVRRVNAAERGGELRLLISETLYLEPSQFGLLVHTAWLCVEVLAAAGSL